MTERRTQAYAVRSAEDTTAPYHTWVRSGSRFLISLVSFGFLAGPGLAEEVRAPGLEVEVVGQIEAPMAEVVATLLDLDGFGRWFPNTEEWEVLERTPDSALAYGRLSLPWPVDDRDYVVRYSWSPETEPKPFRLLSEVAPSVGPAVPEGVVRVEEMATEWEIAPLGTGTRVRYVYTGSPGGMLPDWVFEIGWEMQTGILIDALAEEVERRRTLGDGPPAGERAAP